MWWPPALGARPRFGGVTGQLGTNLRLSGLRLGLLINLAAPVLKDGFEPLVNGLDDP